MQQLSGGNQQRFLMAIMPSNLALLAVEQPTRGLDVDSARWVWTQILARRAEGTAAEARARSAEDESDPATSVNWASSRAAIRWTARIQEPNVTTNSMSFTDP